MVHFDAFAQRHPVGQVGRVAPGVDGDVVAAVGECAREAGDVYVLATRVDAAEYGEGLACSETRAMSMVSGPSGPGDVSVGVLT